MLSVFKYPVNLVDEFSLELPIGARILHVESQAGTNCLWALVDPKAPKELRHFRLAGTGHPIDDYAIGDHIATWQDGPYVWHLFEAGGTR